MNNLKILLFILLLPVCFYILAQGTKNDLRQETIYTDFKRINLLVPKSYKMLNKQQGYEHTIYQWGDSGDIFDRIHIVCCTPYGISLKGGNHLWRYNLVSKDSTIVLGENPEDSTFCLIYICPSYPILVGSYFIRPQTLSIMQYIFNNIEVLPK